MKNSTEEELSLLLDIQRESLEDVALQGDDQHTVARLCLAAERMVPDTMASVMLYNETRDALNIFAAPSLPKAAIDALAGLKPGTDQGSCANAVFRNEPVYVEDAQTDPLWAGVRAFAHEFGIGACWSMPIRTAGGQVAGSFAMTSLKKRCPDEFQRIALNTCSHIAGIALQRQQNLRDLWHIAHHDELTGLPNRLLLTNRIENAKERALRRNSRFAVMFVDLDQFKYVNDAVGHSAGDELLKQAAFRIRGVIRDEDELARVGGDEFVLLLEDLTDYHDVHRVSDRIRKTFESPIKIGIHEFTVSASMGISIYPSDGDDPDTLIQKADTAMYRAKHSGRNQFAFYEPEMTELAMNRVSMETELRHAITHDDLVIHYQPIFSPGNPYPVSLEALVRWQHPEKGLVPPDQFIPLSEETGLIRDLGHWILEKTSAQLRSWLDAGMPELILSVNVSGRQLHAGWHNQIEDILAASGLPAGLLELELTETLAMADDPVAVREIEAISALGITLAIDDFGTGHSSLSRLKDLPFGKLKIDRSFIRDLPENTDSIMIARAVIALGHSLGLAIVAEGVETPEQQQFLVNEGCDLLQGFLLGRPVAANELETLLLSGSPATGDAIG